MATYLIFNAGRWNRETELRQTLLWLVLANSFTRFLRNESRRVVRQIEELLFLFLLGEKLNTSPSFPPCLLKAVPALRAPSSMQSNKHADGFWETRPILHPVGRGRGGRATFRRASSPYWPWLHDVCLRHAYISVRLYKQIAA